MELLIDFPSETVSIPLDGIDITFYTVNDTYSTSISKDYSLAVDIPLRLVPHQDSILQYISTYGSYTCTQVNGRIADGSVSIDCIVSIESVSQSTLSLSVQYASLPISVISQNIKDIDIGTWRTDNFGSFMNNVRSLTDGLLLFPRIYAPQYYTKSQDSETWHGDTEYINNWKEHKTGDAVWEAYYPQVMVDYSGDSPKLLNNNAPMPCIHLSSLLRRIFSLSGFHFDDSHAPAAFKEAYISTLSYPSVPDVPPQAVTQSGINYGTMYTGNWENDIPSPNSKARFWVFAEKEFAVPNDSGTYEVKVTLSSGDLVPIRQANMTTPVPTTFKVKVVGVDKSAEQIEETINLDVEQKEFTFTYTSTATSYGLRTITVKLYASNANHDSTTDFYDMTTEGYYQPYVSDLWMDIEWTPTDNFTYERFFRPADGSIPMWEIRAVDWIAFDTVADLLTTIKNHFGIQVVQDSLSGRIVTLTPDSSPSIHDISDWVSRSGAIRQFNEMDMASTDVTVLSCENEDSPLIVIRDKQPIIYPNQAEWERAQLSTDDITEYKSDFFPLPQKRRVAAWTSSAGGKNCIFAVKAWPTYPNFYIAITTTYDGATYTMEDMWKKMLQYGIGKISSGEKNKITFVVPENVYLRIKPFDLLSIDGDTFDINEIKATHYGNYFLCEADVVG